MIRSERARRGWSQRALARALGVNPSAVAQWETGATKPTMARIIDICNVFGISAQSLFEPGAPYSGQLVEDAEELALLTAWRRLEPEERAFMLRLLRNAGMPIGPEPDEAKPARKHDNAA